MKVLSLHLFSLSYPLDHGNSRAPLKCSLWAGNCARCSRTRSWTMGIFCSNFYWSVGVYPPCHRMWCGRCYTSAEKFPFHVASQATLGTQARGEREDLKEVERLEQTWTGKPQNDLDFHEARDGDHLLPPLNVTYASLGS